MSTISSGGVGENNLAFKCTRKRFIIETFHLDVDGGVGGLTRTTAPLSEEAPAYSESHGNVDQQRPSLVVSSRLIVALIC